MIRVLRSLFWWGSCLAMLFWVLTVPPVIPWRPIDCHGQPMNGPLSRQYADQMAWWFKENNVGYRRSGNRLFLRILPLFDGTEQWSRENVINNGEHKGAYGIMYDTSEHGLFFPPPAAVRRLQALPPPDDDQEVRSERYCALLRAAILDDPD